MSGPARGFPPEDADEDRDLVDRARRGDQEAFRRIVEKYERRVRGLVWGLVGDRSDAEDVAQEAFLRAFRSLSSFGGRSSFRTWLFQIALNAARTHRQSRRSRLQPEAVDPADLERAPETGSVEQGLIARDRLRRALGQLPADMREAVLLRDVEGFEYREIAELLDIPIGTVESRIFRGRARLREALAAQTIPET
ncbi:MAG: sigma-70 family RNA polymerase sigma factor [Acidobacteriota bacterium]|nr:MAG: RNA polymerase sigma factor RpoE [Acidobacteriota bacterium]